MNVWPSRDEMVPIYEALYLPHKEYVRTVSPRGMALSIDLCVYAWWLAEHTNALRVADLGSGFSSYLLRRYALERRGVEVASVDDSEEWLGRTEKFLVEHDVPTGNLWGPDEFRSYPELFDLIVHDYSSGEEREAMMVHAADHLAPGGFILFDDAQHEGHRMAMCATARMYGFELLDVWEQTVDRVGRFGLLARRPSRRP